MPVAGKTLDVDQFRKCVALFESSISGEAASAIRMALKLCADCNLRFCDAAALAYGDDHAEEIAQLQSRLEQQEALTAARLTEAAEICQRVRGENAALKAELSEARAQQVERRETAEHRSVREFLAFSWGFAQCRVMVLLLAGGCALAMAAGRGGFAVAGCVVFSLCAIWLFLLWCAAEVDESGFGVLLIKAVVLVAGVGCAAVYAASAYGDSWEVLPVFGVVALLTATRIINNVTKSLKSNAFVGAVLGWFL